MSGIIANADYVKASRANGDGDDGAEDSVARESSLYNDKADELMGRVLRGDQEALELWSKTRAWVISGQRKTLSRLGVRFDRLARVAGGAARAQPTPHDLAGEAQLIEPGLIIAVQARGQDLALPRARRGLEALQLLEDAEQAVGADQLRVLGGALPAQQEAHERGGAHRLDLLAQPREGEPMDAGEHPAVAPLELAERVQIVGGGDRRARSGRAARAGGRGRRERAAEDRAVHPDLQRFCAKRMGATTVELNSSHVPMLSQPRAVLEVIRNVCAAVPAQ